MDYLWTHFSKILILGECFIERRQEHAGVRPHGPRHEVRNTYVIHCLTRSDVTSVERGVRMSHYLSK